MELFRKFKIRMLYFFWESFVTWQAFNGRDEYGHGQQKFLSGKYPTYTIEFLQITGRLFGFGRYWPSELVATGIPGPGSSLAAYRRSPGCGHLRGCRDHPWRWIDNPAWQVSGDCGLGYRSILCNHLPRQYLAIRQPD